MPHHQPHSPEQAVLAVQQTLDRDAILSSETVPTQSACGRVLAATARAGLLVPAACVSTRDGAALPAASAAGAAPGRPVRLDFHGAVQPVRTGQPLPPGADCVVMEERLSRDGDAVILTTAPAPGDFTLPAGQDAEPGRVMAPAGRLLQPWDLAGLLSAGVFEVTVHAPVRAVFLPTGEEVLPFQDRPDPGPGQVVESSSQGFLTMARSLGALAESRPPVPDDPHALRQAIRDALDRGAHCVVLGAGSGPGSRDHARTVLESMGRILARGLAMAPGRTGVLAECDGRLLACAPGPPAGSAAFCEEVLAPVLAWLGRRDPPHQEVVHAELADDVSSRPGVARLARVQLGRVGGRLIARLPGAEDGPLQGLCRTQGRLRIPADRDGFRAGETAPVERIASNEEIGSVILTAGRRAGALDRLAEALLDQRPPLQLLHKPTAEHDALDALRHGRAAAACVSAGLAGAAPRIVPLGRDSDLVVSEAAPALLPDAARALARRRAT